MAELKLGMVGLDTSHAKVFSRVFHDPGYEHHLDGAKITVAYPGGSPDFKASISRVEGYTEELRNLGVKIVDTPEEVAKEVDAVLLTSVDGRVHPEQFKKVAPFGKPVFIDKPLAVSLEEAAEIAETAKKYGIPWMSASVRRFATDLAAALAPTEKGPVMGADCYGPIEFVPSQPGYFWYGIHSVEVLYRVFGQGCKSVTAFSNGDSETVTAVWRDGRIGTVRGIRGNGTHGVTLIREKTSEFVDTTNDQYQKYANLLQAVLTMFRTSVPVVANEETLETIRFIEAVNESRASGKTVLL